jgi:hypothetical protein
MKQRVVQILKQNNLSVKEKYDRIEKLQNEFNKYCGEAKRKLIAHYTYCPYCKTYYKNKAWEEEYFIDTQLIYEENNYSISLSKKIIEVPYIRKTCPVGHIIEVEDENSSLV